MIKRLEKINIDIIICYMYLISFGGIITKLTIFNKGLFAIKQIIPDVLLFFIAINGLVILINKSITNKFKKKLIVIFYFIICLILSLFTLKTSIFNTFYTIRDIFLPFVILYILMEIELYKEYSKKINNSLLIYSILTSVAGFLLAIFQYINGYEWTSKFYTGRIFYGMDEVSNIMINNTINGRLRIPSVAGNSVLFGFYSLIVFVLIFNLMKKGIIKNIFLIISISNVILSTNKTCIVLIIILVINHLLRNIKFNLKIALYNFGGIILIILVFYLINNTNMFYSIIDRINETWIGIFKDIDLVSIIIPYNSFNIGSSIRNINDVKSYVDNSYIYILLTYGIVGLMIYLNTIIQVMKKCFKNRIILNQLSIIALVSGVTISIFQGRSFFTPYCLIVGLLYFDNKLYVREKNDINNF